MTLEQRIDRVYAELAGVNLRVATPITNKAYYTTEELAQILGRSKHTIVAWRKSGKIPCAKRIGRLWAFDRAIIHRLIAQGKFTVR